MSMLASNNFFFFEIYKKSSFDLEKLKFFMLMTDSEPRKSLKQLIFLYKSLKTSNTLS